MKNLRNLRPIHIPMSQPGTSKVFIEPMIASHLEAVMSIDRRSYLVPWHASAYITELNNRAATYLVALAGEEIVAYGGIWVIMDEGHITTLAVDPIHRGKHFGEQVLLALLDEAITRRATHITLEVRQRNEAARALYAKYRFRPRGVRRGYYTDNGEDAVVMWVEDIDKPEYRAFLIEQRSRL